MSYLKEHYNIMPLATIPLIYRNKFDRNIEADIYEYYQKLKKLNVKKEMNSDEKLKVANAFDVELICNIFYACKCASERNSNLNYLETIEQIEDIYNQEFITELLQIVSVKN